MTHLRRTAIAGLLLALPAAASLTSCGFDYPTDRVNTIAAGVNNRDHSVDALGMRVLASSAGKGRVIGALVNNNDTAASLTQVTAPSGDAKAGAFEPVEIAPLDRVNLADLDIPLTGTFTAGGYITLELTFSTKETFSLEVPVVKPCFQYTAVPTPDAETGHQATEGEHADATESEAPDEHASEHAETSGDATYNCADEAPEPGAEH